MPAEKPVKTVSTTCHQHPMMEMRLKCQEGDKSGKPLWLGPLISTHLQLPVQRLVCLEYKYFSSSSPCSMTHGPGDFSSTHYEINEEDPSLLEHWTCLPAGKVCVKVIISVDESICKALHTLFLVCKDVVEWHNPRPRLQLLNFPLQPWCLNLKNCQSSSQLDLSLCQHQPF